ncbi:MAG: cell division protein FtsB [Nitrosomonadales bacterium]|nr:cell division protein FtsB [Nitrosomonadales bacterium]
MSRLVTLILVVLLLLLQYPLWLGKGSWLKVWELHRQVAAQQQLNQQTQARNALLDAEVRDLKQGTEAIEERARSELGMVKRDEMFFQMLDDSADQTTKKLALQAPASAVSGVIHIAR